MDRDQLIAEIKKQLQEEIKNLSEPLSDKISQEHKDKALEIKNEAANFVKENPWMSIAMAAVAGFVIARWIYKGDEE